MVRDQYTNKAGDRATVGAQVGRAEGSVTISQSVTASQSSASIADELAELRRQVEEAALKKDLDPDLVGAARSSLDAAESAVRNTDESEPRRHERLYRALRTLQAAVSSVAGLSEAVASLIKSISGAS